VVFYVFFVFFAFFAYFLAFIARCFCFSFAAFRCFVRVFFASGRQWAAPHIVSGAQLAVAVAG